MHVSILVQTVSGAILQLILVNLVIVGQDPIITLAQHVQLDQATIAIRAIRDRFFT